MNGAMIRWSCIIKNPIKRSARSLPQEWSDWFVQQGDLGQIRSSGDVGSRAGLPETGHARPFMRLENLDRALKIARQDLRSDEAMPKPLKAGQRNPPLGREGGGCD